MCSIIIENKSSIDLDNKLLLKIVKQSNLPLGKLLLILSNNGLGNRYGACIPRSTLKYTVSGSVFRLFKERLWDVSVALSKDVCAEQVIYPAFFTYLLGHELGHAYICLLDVKIHIFYCLLEDFYNKVAEKKLQIYEFPHEKCFDQFGIYVAKQLYSRAKLKEEIEKLLLNPIRKDKEYLSKMQSYSGINMLADLKSNLIDFAKPYKDELIGLWKKDVEERKGYALASEIDDFETLFE